MPREWECRLDGDLIQVSFGGKAYGAYKLLTDPYCRKCAYPGVATDTCKWHHDDYGFDRIYAMGTYISSKTHAGYNDLLSKHIRGLKRYRNYAHPLGKGLALCLKHRFPELLKFDVIVPMPKHRDELRESQFNQALELASVVSAKVKIPCAETLEKLSYFKQKGLTRESRKNIVRGKYKCTKPSFVRGRKVILLDDVTTSGASASECSAMLANAGAEIIDVVVAGRDLLVPE